MRFIAEFRNSSLTRVAAETADTALIPPTGFVRIGESRILGRESRESQRMRSGFVSIFFIESTQNDRTLGVENGHYHRSFRRSRAIAG
jgi:hypothetical protein